MTQQLPLPRPQTREEINLTTDNKSNENIYRETLTPSPSTGDNLIPELAAVVPPPTKGDQFLQFPKPNAREGRKSPVQEKIAMFMNNSSQNDPRNLGELEYGRPVVGSKTEARGLKAHAHVFKEILELCEIINTEGNIRFRDEDGQQRIGILFGDLFRIYTIISDKCVGLLLRARKHHLVTFEGETLFQRRDDNTPIFLTKTMDQIKEELCPTAKGDEGTVAWHTGVTSAAT